jgi:hypothetical protein
VREIGVGEQNPLTEKVHVLAQPLESEAYLLAETLQA